MSRSNLLLTLDAFGTLFRPKASVAQQYGHVARRLGLSGFNDDDLQASLVRAIKAETRRNPNYGKATGLGAAKWWTNVIHNTFTPLLKHGEPIPPDLAPRLIHQFSSDQAYTMEPDLLPALQALKHHRRHSHRQHCPPARRAFGDILVGVVTNSDDRVPSILASFGLSVSPLRYGTATAATTTTTSTPAATPDATPASTHDATPGTAAATSFTSTLAPTTTTATFTCTAGGSPALRSSPGPELPPGQATHAPHDIDFHCISYDVGFEKPDPSMFRAAEHMLAQILAVRDAVSPSIDDAGTRAAETWQKVHVGDEFAKDVVGAVDAGWKAVLLDHEEEEEQGGKGCEGSSGLPWMEDVHVGSGSARAVGDLFRENEAVRVRSLTGLMRWLAGQ